MSDRRKFGLFAAKGCLVLASTVASYFIVEAVFFRLIFPTINPDVRPHLPETAGVLAQNTKAEFVPRDYLALLGDSVAEGLGDSLLASGNNEARNFHAAHVIHAMNRRDVVSFGRGGSGSAEGLVRQPARILGGSQCFLFPTLPDPSQIFAYFYEGNDLQDNLIFAKKKVAAKFGRADGEAIDAYLSDDYARFASWRCHLYLFDVGSRLSRFFYQYYYLGISPFQFRPTPGGNRIHVGEEVIDAPAPLDGPALEVGDEDARLAILVLDRSLAWLRARFARTPITVVYVPAALSVYQLVGPSYHYSIEPREDGKTGWASPAEIAKNSDAICNLVRATAARHDLGFFDVRPALREAAAGRLLHGPVDWVHFNEQGYRVFGTALARRDDLARVDSCN